MTTERPQPEHPFALTEQERLFERLSHTRFMALLRDERTTVHQIQVSTNSYGEFLFVTLSQRAGQNRVYLTFWGLGFHELRERWITGEWQWYESQPSRNTVLPSIDRIEAQYQVTARMDEMASSITPLNQSKRAQLFELLADLTDEDGAISELEDLGIWDDEEMD